jgi:hypothetical protein
MPRRTGERRPEAAPAPAPRSRWLGWPSWLRRTSLRVRIAAAVVAAAVIAGALSTLASPSASSYLTGPVYASPRDACTLIKASTLARYARGAIGEQPSSSARGGVQVSNCGWAASIGSLDLFVAIYADDDSALGGYEFDVKYAHQNRNEMTFLGAQPVRGLGDQATAIFQTIGGSPDVAVYVLSGNAEIFMSISDLPFSPTLSRAEKLAADIAMARDVLADLPR